MAGKTDFANGMSKGSATAVRRVPAQPVLSQADQNVTKEAMAKTRVSGLWDVVTRDGKAPAQKAAYEIDLKGDVLTISEIDGDKRTTKKWTVDGQPRTALDGDVKQTLVAKWDQDTVVTDQAREACDARGCLTGVIVTRWSLSSDSRVLNIAQSMGAEAPGSGKRAFIAEFKETAERRPN